MPSLKAPGSKRLTLEYNELLSSFAFEFNLRCYTVGASYCLSCNNAEWCPGADVCKTGHEVGWCRLTLSDPR